MCAPSGAHPCLFLGTNILLTFSGTLRVPTRLTTRGAPGSGSSSYANRLNLSPRLPFCLTFQWANSSPALAHFFPVMFLGSQSRVQPRLSPIAYSTLSPSFVSLPPALINILSKPPGVMLWNLSCMKSRIHTLHAGLKPGPCPVTEGDLGSHYSYLHLLTRLPKPHYISPSWDQGYTEGMTSMDNSPALLWGFRSWLLKVKY